MNGFSGTRQAASLNLARAIIGGNFPRAGCCVGMFRGWLSSWLFRAGVVVSKVSRAAFPSRAPVIKSCGCAGREGRGPFCSRFRIFVASEARGRGHDARGILARCVVCRHEAGGPAAAPRPCGRGCGAPQPRAGTEAPFGCQADGVPGAAGVVLHAEPRAAKRSFSGTPEKTAAAARHGCRLLAVLRGQCRMMRRNPRHGCQSACCRCGLGVVYRRRDTAVDRLFPEG